MRRRLVAFCVLFCLSFVFSSTTVVFGRASFWNQTFGGEAGDYAHGVAEAADGGYVIGGYSNSFRTFGTTKYDSFLIKVDSNGRLMWNRTYGLGILSSLITTKNGEFVFVGNNRLVKTDSAGNQIWNKTYGSAGVQSVIEAQDGGFVIAGTLLHTWERDFLLIKTDSEGNMLWNKTYDNGVNEEARCLVETVDGGYALAGTSSYYDFPIYDGFSNFWLVKTDKKGQIEWNQTYSGPTFESAYCLVQASDQGYIVAGHTSSDANGWVVKTDSQGTVEWTRTFGEEYQDDQIFSVIQTEDGGFTFAGHSTYLGAGRSDFWLVKLNSLGRELWSQTYGGSGMDMAYSFIQTTDGGYVLVGDTYSFGAGDSDFWIIKTNGHGIIPEFSTWTILPLFFVFALIIIRIRTKFEKKNFQIKQSVK